MLYLGSPYTHKDAEVRHARYLQVEEACAKFHARNIVVYSPIMHWHNCAVRLKLPSDAAPWEIQNYGVLSRCTEMGVLKLDGWQESKGLKGEVKEAGIHGLRPIGYEFVSDILIQSGFVYVTDFK